MGNNDFINIYNKSCRLGTAVFAVANIMEEDELKNRLKKLSIEIISMTVSLKETSAIDSKRLIGDIEKQSLLLMSLIDISAITGSISAMNGKIIKEEFQYFISVLKQVFGELENNKNLILKDVFGGISGVGLVSEFNNGGLAREKMISVPSVPNTTPLNNSTIKNTNGSKRKDVRKNTIMNFIKGHNNVSIKDIVPNIVGCSEKTIQRELLELISEGKIIKNGERRWSRYSIK